MTKRLVVGRLQFVAAPQLAGAAADQPASAGSLQESTGLSSKLTGLWKQNSLPSGCIQLTGFEGACFEAWHGSGLRSDELLLGDVHAPHVARLFEDAEALHTASRSIP